MNKKWYLVLSIIQFAIGFLIALSFVVLAIGGYEVRQYISTFVAGFIFAVAGVIGIVKWLKANK